MIWKNALTLFSLCLMVMPLSAAQAQLFNPNAPSSVKKQLFNPNNVVIEASKLLPVLDGTDLKGEPKRVLTRDIGDKLYNRCLSEMPPRFTPDAHRYYCTCSSAATVGNLTRGELNELQNVKNRVLGNKTFEKYTKDVISPCMDVPLDQIEYLACVVTKSNDARIPNIPSYCKCLSASVGLHFKKYGVYDMLTTWRDGKSKMFNDPVGALWESSDLQNARNLARRNCVKNHIRVDPFKN